MWECSKCKQEITRDKYKVCWNCGSPKPTEPEKKEKVRRKATEINQRPLIFGVPQEIKPSVVRDFPKLEPESLPIVEKTEPIVEQKLEQDQSSSPKTEINLEPKITENVFPLEAAQDFKETSSSKFKTFVIFVLWLAVLAGISYFAYSSNQKTLAFELKILANIQNFDNQRSQFIFPPLPKLKRDESLQDSNIHGKVLPLNIQTKQVDRLYNFLPDDLRPNSLNEVKNILWLDCTKEEVGKYLDGATGYQNRCKTFLVERETSKFIGIQDFLGIMPALAKNKESEDAVGDVLPEKYIAYLKGKQTEAERGNLQLATDSPDHHFFSKSEFYYAILLLGVIAAIGFGWITYKLRFDNK